MLTKQNVVIVIPARYQSSRFPGKSLAPIQGRDGAKPLIKHTWEVAQSVPCINGVYVATDDQRIADCVTDFGGQVVMTPNGCQNGTERCAAALAALGINPDVVVNIQGDALLTPDTCVSALIAGLEQNPKYDVATPIVAANSKITDNLYQDKTQGRVGATTAVVSRNNTALYFSKEILPYVHPKTTKQKSIFYHMGVYAYRPRVLFNYMEWAAGDLETSEGLEQLRFLENGTPILCVKVDLKGHESWEVNIPEDVPRVETILRTRKPK